MADQSGSSERAPQWAPARLTIYECTTCGGRRLFPFDAHGRADEIFKRCEGTPVAVEVMRVADIVGAPGTWPELPEGRTISEALHAFDLPLAGPPAELLKRLFTEEEVRAREAWFRRQWAENIGQLDAAMRHELAGYFTAAQVRPLWETLAMSCQLAPKGSRAETRLRTALDAFLRA